MELKRHFLRVSFLAEKREAKKKHFLSLQKNHQKSNAEGVFPRHESEQAMS